MAGSCVETPQVASPLPAAASVVQPVAARWGLFSKHRFAPTALLSFELVRFKVCTCNTPKLPANSSRADTLSTAKSLRGDRSPVESADWSVGDWREAGHGSVAYINTHVVTERAIVSLICTAQFDITGIRTALYTESLSLSLSVSVCLSVFFFCDRSTVLRRSEHRLPGIGWCGAGPLPFLTACWWLTHPAAITGVCFRQMEQSWRMWWTVCSASLQSQSVESLMQIRFRSARRPQCPVRNLKIVVCSCLARRLIGSVEGL